MIKRIDSQPEWDRLCPEWALPELPPPERKLIISLENGPDFRCGEPISFRITLDDRGHRRNGIPVRAVLQPEFSQFTTITGVTPLEIETRMERPGFVRIEAATPDGMSAALGAAVEPEKILPVEDVPGFDEFWNAQFARLAAVPLRVEAMREIAPVRKEYEERVRCFDVQVACAGARPVSGILAKPVDAAPRSCPGYLFFHGAGVRSAFQPLTWAARGMLAFNVNAHGIPNAREMDYYRKLDENELAGYAVRSVASPEESPFCEMFLRVKRAIEFLKSLPEWDGSILAVHGGSQGGLQSIVAAAVDPAVNFCMIQAPAMCNQAALLEGRANVWPHVMTPGDAGKMNDIARFFDGVSFARRMNRGAKVYFTAGYSDTEAVPSSVCAAFHACTSCDKEFAPFTDCGHAGAVFWSGEAELDHYIRTRRNI